MAHPRTSPGVRKTARAIRAALIACSLAVVASTAARAADEIHWTIIGQTAVTFDWRGSASENTLQYGTSPGNYTGSVTAQTPSPTPDSSPGPFWEARVTGLAENTLYYYRIGTGAEHTFRTPLPRGNSGYWIAEMADVGSTLGYAPVGPTQSMIAQDHPNLPGDDRPRFVLVPGDLTYGDQNSIAEVDGHFNDVMAWSQDAAYMVAWGNHEWATAADGMADNLNNYEGRFDFHNSQTSPGASAAVGNGPGEDWYWFDYGNVRFIAFPEPYSGAWSDWATRADAVMAAAQSDPAITFIVTFGHRPPWSSGADHGGDSQLAGYMATLHGKYSKYVLNMGGHSHHYERTDPAQTNGILHIVGPGGGSSLGGLSSTQPSWSVFRIDHLEHIRLHIQPDRIDGFVVCGPSGSGNSDSCTQGTIIDQWTILAPGGADTTPPAAVTDLRPR